MRILIVSHDFAPQASPRAYRWTTLADDWVRRGHRVVVVAARRPGAPAHEQRTGLEIHRVGNPWIERLRSFFGGRRSSGGAAPGTTRPPRPSLAKRIHDATLKQVYWPDHAFHWLRPAREAALRLCTEKPFDAVVTVSHPFTGHVVGLALKKHFPTLRWIADIGDPFSLLTEIPVNNHRLHGRRNRQVDRAVLAGADAAAVTVEGCRVLYAEAFPESAAKITVIAPLLSLPPIKAVAADEERRAIFPDSRIPMVFVGTLYRALRDPDPLLRLFNRLRSTDRRLSLHIFGDVNDCAESFGDPDETGVERHGTVPRALAARAMAEAAILVNIGNSSTHQLPSKLIEYIATGKPILNIAKPGADTGSALLATYPAVVTVPPRPDGPSAEDLILARALIENLPNVDPSTVARLIHPFRLAAISEAYLALLEGKATP